MVFDDDHYYLGGALAELLAREGYAVTLVDARGARLGVDGEHDGAARASSGGCSKAASTLETAHRRSAPTPARADRLRLHRARARASPATRSCSSRRACPHDALAEELQARRSEWDGCGLRSVRAVGDAFAPGTIATAVWDGRRYAEELDDDADRRRRPVPARGGGARPETIAPIRSHCATMSRMLQPSGAPRRSKTIQSVDRAAALLKAIADGRSAADRGRARRGVRAEPLARPGGCSRRSTRTDSSSATR